MAVARLTPLPEPPLEIRPAGEPHAGYHAGKRALDVIGALLLLAVGLPIMAVAVGLIVLTSGWPPLFGQKRMGMCGRVFTCWKLRTMVRDAEVRRAEVVHLNVVNGPAFKTRHDPRVTRIGKWLRTASIDELPQAVNILRGEMSLVGPRPLPLVENQYDGEQALRLSVKPGLTCIWQISGRSDVKFEQWMALDIEYVRTRSLAKDIELIAKTVPAVLTVRGAA
ncbi:MAG TPA: sugar transferase [Dehalococcoidia bacterium]|nr:sugar transferase [Dehalococcoidia bacterium]